jgi:hypothetical protein
MARPASIEVAGYFPTPRSVLARIASVVTWPRGSAHGLLLDPCAGDGEAICALRTAWSGVSTAYYTAGPAIVACELEADRAKALRAALGQHRDRAFHGDAFRLVPASRPGGSGGAAVLYLNPPYDDDRDFGRLEQRFLARFTDHLGAGTGILLLLVPHGALVASAEHLAAHFADLRCRRLPRPEFEQFGQVLVAGRRRPRPLDAPEAASRVLAWARDPEQLEVLPESCPDPFEIPAAGTAWYQLSYELAEADVDAAVAAFDPWPAGETGGRLPARDLLGARYPVAQPPKPAHIALALAAGMFNGHRLEPDDPSRFPPVLAKGAYRREAVEIDRKVNDSGETTAITTVDCPRLTVTVLRLDTGTFHTLAEGTEPAGGDDLTAWTAADLLIHYGRSMADLLRRQFPPLHDPADPGGRIALPELARRPFTAQDHAVQTALKLLATGRNPFLDAEVGTGKTTMALYIAAALSPAHHAATAGQLARLGYTAPPPVVRRTLVLCPPHLLGSWRDQAAAVIPEARVRIVDEAADLAADAEIYILSRERAKLGHGHEGVASTCPRCGSAVKAEPEANASRRLRCEAAVRRPANFAARLAIDLATLLAHAVPGDDLVASLAPRRLREHFRRTGSAPLPVGRLALFLDGLLDQLRAILEHPISDQRHSSFYSLLRLITAVTTGLGQPPSVTADRLRSLAEKLGQTSGAELLYREARTLRDAPDSDTDRDTPQPLLRALEELDAAARWHAAPACGEPLYQAVPPRRLPLAREILRRHRRRFGLVIVDEVHEANNGRSAQSKATHRLTGLPGVPTIALSGSLMGGYSSALFTNFHALSSDFRREFGRDDEGEFVARYGYRKIRISYRERETNARLGTHTDREVASRRVIGEAPGVHPLFLTRYLLPTAVLVHKEDLDQALPPLSEEPVSIAPPENDTREGELLAEYRRLQDALLTRIRADRYDPDLAGRLFGALAELPSYLDRATADLEPFEIRYPESVGGHLVAAGRTFPRTWRTPKERWLLDEIAARTAAGERVLVFLRHTRTQLPRRLLRLVQSVAPGAVWLDTPKVPTARREAWIDRQVNDTKAPVLLVNPNAVRTGLNNLVGFSTGIWYELDYSADTYRQAIGRLHRIGQVRPVTIRIPYYQGTAQEIAFDLVARKVSASLQVDGLDVRAALEAAGAGGGLPDGLDAALSLGKAVYRALRRAA